MTIVEINNLRQDVSGSIFHITLVGFLLVVNSLHNLVEGGNVGRHLTLTGKDGREALEPPRGACETL